MSTSTLYALFTLNFATVSEMILYGLGAVLVIWALLVGAGYIFHQFKRKVTGRKI